MRTVKNDLKRKQLFDLTIKNYYAGYGAKVKSQLRAFSKIDLIRFVNYLAMYHNGVYIDINGAGDLHLFETR